MRRPLAALSHECGRAERDGGPVRTVTLRLVTDHGPRAMWEMIARPDQLARWFAPVTGDLRPGGRYRIAGNAEGTILACAPAARLSLTWEFAGEVSWVDIDLAPFGGGGSRLTLTHSARETERWRVYGPGAAGVGWELALLGLVGRSPAAGGTYDATNFAASPEGRAYVAMLARSWGEAAIAAGDEPEAAWAAARATAAFYGGDPLPD